MPSGWARRGQESTCCSSVYIGSWWHQEASSRQHGRSQSARQIHCNISNNNSDFISTAPFQCGIDWLHQLLCQRKQKQKRTAKTKRRQTVLWSLWLLEVLFRLVHKNSMGFSNTTVAVTQQQEQLQPEGAIRRGWWRHLRRRRERRRCNRPIFRGPWWHSRRRSVSSG